VLRAAFGQDEVNHGAERYRVGAGGLVLVPPAVAVHLIHNGGFQVVPRPEAMRATHAPIDLQPELC
jgi:hypothetical protein